MDVIVRASSPSSRGLRSRLSIPRAPVYPTLLAATLLVSAYASTNVSLEALWRPLLVGVAVMLVAQFVVGRVLLSNDRGAYVVLILLLLAAGLPSLALVLSGWVAAATCVALWRGLGLRTMPWLRANRILNAGTSLVLGLVVVNAAVAGAFTFANGGGDEPRGVAKPGSPDIYLVMLDGYPRADTLMSDFDFDNRPFLQGMESLGFDVARSSHSNYDATVLTLASMANGSQMPDLVPRPPAAITSQFRAVTRLINDGRRWRDFRAAGYEIVTIPSGYYEGTLVSADRVLDSGQLSTFEMQLLTRGGIPLVAGGLEREVLPDQHRSRILATFDRLGELAAERTGTPKLVFAHVLAPHMPIAFAADGSAVEPLPCYPKHCSLYDYGDMYGVADGAPMRDQIVWLNGVVEATVRTIQDRSEQPPVVILFSDHGLRNKPGDKEEMLRSLFLAATPGHPRLFPDDASPVNLLTRLLNGYADRDLALASDDAYWLDTRLIYQDGLFAYVPWPSDLAEREP